MRTIADIGLLIVTIVIMAIVVIPGIPIYLALRSEAKKIKCIKGNK